MLSTDNHDYNHVIMGSMVTPTTLITRAVLRLVWPLDCIVQN